MTIEQFVQLRNKLLNDIIFHNFNTNVELLSMAHRRTYYRIPDYQRDYVWDNTKASRYIESLLLELPSSSLIVQKVETNDDIYYNVVDGSQRLRTIYRFTDDLLVLEGCNLLVELNGLKFSNFCNKLKNKFRNSNLAMSVFSGQYSEKQIYSIFERINSCTALTDMDFNKAKKVLCD